MKGEIMEQKLQIKTPDNHLIYGTLSGSDKPKDKLVIFVHGFTGFCNEHIFYNGAKFLKNNNIANFRFDLYNWQDKARSFLDCDIQTHVDDLKTVFNYFKDEYQKIYLIGHSLGGIVVLESKLPAAGIILWDSSHSGSKILDEEYEYISSKQIYLLNWGIVYAIGKKMYDDKKFYSDPKELISWIRCPIKIICAGDGVLVEGGEEYYKLAKEPKEFSLIEGADHTFDEGDTEDELFQQTLDFVKKY